jgi:flavin-dependent dehydrogenase
MKCRPISIVGMSCALISAALATDTAEKPSLETTAITNQAAEYEKAYNARDAKALAQFLI